MEQNKWYYLEKNKTQGPTSTKELLKKIESGQLGPFDLIYRKGEGQWKSMAQFREFHSVFNKLPIQLKKEWILLSKNLEKKGQFNIDGPFSTLEIQKKIEGGQIKYTDYVWKGGMTRWYQLAHLKEFNPQEHQRVEFKEFAKKEEEIFLQAPEEVIEIKNIMIQKRKTSSLLKKKHSPENPTEIPKDREAEDLTKSPSSLDEREVLLQKSLNSKQEIKSKLSKIEETQTVHISSNKSSEASQKKQGGEEKNKALSNFFSKLASFLFLLSYSILFKKVLKPLFFLLYKITKATLSLLIKKWKKTRKKSSIQTAPKPEKGIQSVKQMNSPLLEFLIGRTSLFLLFTGFAGFLAYHFLSSPFINQKKELPSKSSKEERRQEEKHSQALKKKLPNKKRKKNSTNSPSSSSQKETSKSSLSLKPLKLHIATQGLKGSSPNLKIFANRKSKKIEVFLHGQAGSLSKNMSFYKNFTFKNKKQIQISLKALNMGSEGYTVFVKGEGLKKEKNFFLGRKITFKKNIKKMRKSLSFFQQKERYRLFLISLALFNQSNELMKRTSLIDFSNKKWRLFLSQWKKDLQRISAPEIERINWKTISKFIYPKIWMDLKDFKAQLIKKANERPRKKNKNKWTQEVKEISMELDKIHRKSKKLSLWF